jgi:hypothetical protein
MPAPQFDLGTVTMVATKAVPGPITPEIQKKLYDETDARFVAKTKITHKLDPNNPLDQKLVPAWAALYRDVLTAYQHGALVWTHQDPTVANAVQVARDTGKAFADLLSAPIGLVTDIATGAGRPATATQAAAAPAGYGPVVTSPAAATAKDVHRAAVAAADHAQHAQHALDHAAGGTTPRLPLDLVWDAARTIANSIGQVVHTTADAAAAIQAQDAPAHVAATESAPVPPAPPLATAAPAEPGSAGAQGGPTPEAAAAAFPWKPVIIGTAIVGGAPSIFKSGGGKRRRSGGGGRVMVIR